MLPQVLGFAALAALVLGAVTRDEERYDPLGIALDVPPRYEAVPVQPSEPWIVLRYVGEKRAKEEERILPSLFVVKVPWRADPEPCPEPAPITTFERYFAQRWSTWEPRERPDEKALKPRAGWTSKEYDLAQTKAQTPFVGWACVLRAPECTWILLGFCGSDELEKELRQWRRCVETMEFFEPVAAKDEAKWRKFYERSPAFRNPEVRLRLRSRLIDGWEAEDTENYLLVYSTRNENLINHLAKRLEGIRREYASLFPAASEITAVSTVRVCKDEDEYRRYGGPVGSAGSWNARNEELVLYVFDEGGQQQDKDTSRSVLLHEAFHQYIHYAAGELDPHSWFNEGYGDYFGGAVFNLNGSVGRIEVHPWRIETIQRALSSTHPSWREIVWMPKEEFYGPGKGVNYAMAWSMIYFLNQCKLVKKNKTWERILPLYFETLKSAHQRTRERLTAEGLAEDEEEIEKANTKARDEASSTAFREVDLDEIEAAWREFTLGLKPPK